ncbi:hypothetical protein EWM64_g8186 [Hericium alpestre]|uniref:Uncharacterized protein n=1 Tax=Hericium alpestre TaxID=135208 RepID=A0A4Y9ZLU3_9AGAM|nr:hypothetical protein EWM64_g8186 [Hericium alpestre]
MFLTSLFRALRPSLHLAHSLADAAIMPKGVIVNHAPHNCRQTDAANLPSTAVQARTRSGTRSQSKSVIVKYEAREHVALGSSDERDGPCLVPNAGHGAVARRLELLRTTSLDTI